MHDLLIELPYIVAGLLLTAYSLVFVTNYKGMADWTSRTIYPYGDEGSTAQYANTRPIVIRLVHVAFALFGLGIFGLGALGRQVNGIPGGIYFGTLFVFLILDILAMTIVSNVIHHRRRQEVRHANGSALHEWKAADASRLPRYSSRSGVGVLAGREGRLAPARSAD